MAIQSRPTSHFFPLFPFFFLFFLLLPFSHLDFPGRSSFRAVGRKKRDKNGTQIPGVNGQLESHTDILVASPVFYLICTFRNTRREKMQAGQREKLVLLSPLVLILIKGPNKFTDYLSCANTSTTASTLIVVLHSGAIVPYPVLVNKPGLTTAHFHSVEGEQRLNGA